MSVEEIEKSFIEYINANGGVVNSFGKLEFTNSNRIGQGGNGLIYLAKINEKEVAVKFLISGSERKVTSLKYRHIF